MVFGYLGDCLLHHVSPLSIAQNGDDHIKRVKRGFEGNVLVKIQAAGDHIDNNPDEPLLQVFTSQSPDAHEREGCGERVGQRHPRVGEIGQEKIECKPDAQRDNGPDEGQAEGEVGDLEM